ncbi:MAG: hypothetical protein H7Z39_21450 [Burkholderiaceae bacterium]|nr:hypothetical protein [Burkholderiaceae bacterium]
MSFIPPPGAAAFWEHPDDVEALEVWADTLLERGDVRGEFIHLSLLSAPNLAQQARTRTLRGRSTALVGPAKPYLGAFSLGAKGLVTQASCSGRKLIDGFAHLAALNPRLALRVLSLRGEAQLAAVAALPLRAFRTLHLDGLRLGDAKLKVLAPALEGVANLSLSNNALSGDALSALRPYAGRLEALALGTSYSQNALGRSIVDAWAEALLDIEAFGALRVVSFHNHQAPPSSRQLERLRALPNLRRILLSLPITDPDELERLKGAATGPG